MDLQTCLDYLKNYNGEEVSFMEVCGSHTEAIAKSGIKTIISDKIHLVSGPGCPVCVSPSGYVDKLVELAFSKDTVVATFGDMMRVPGSKGSLNDAAGQGADVTMVYSPMDVIKLAEESPDKTFVFAAVGFETTIPVYTLLLDHVVANDIKNIKLLTALKVMPPIIDWLCANNANVDGFIAPGHVSVITGSDYYIGLSKKHKIPFSVSGFKPEELVIGIYGLLKMWENKDTPDYKLVRNFYPSVVTAEGNAEAKRQINKYFTPAKARWRGIGDVDDSGLYLREEYLCYDAGSFNLDSDIKLNKACRCGDVLMGKIDSTECPLFGKLCTPTNPEGACMVSTEGSCYVKAITK
ncbi:MAG: hydrogenase formation protein HypD [Lachnospiraceae bacterium]|nr:hydrogenase formation protein HypD [Lachnospiraceae bacterium]